MKHADVKPSLIDLEADNTATGGKLSSTDDLQPERLIERDNVYTVYWIHLNKHNDFLTEGYVGITKNLKERIRSHKRSKGKTHFYYAIKKYSFDKLKITILHKNLTLKEALTFENKYRPKQNIGWNSQIGGILGVEPSWYKIEENRIKHSINTSIRTKEGIKLKDTTEKRSLRAKKLWENGIYDRESNVGSKNPRAILNEEKVKNIKCNLIKQGLTNKEIAKMYSVKPYVINWIRINKNWKHVICDSPAHK